MDYKDNLNNFDELDIPDDVIYDDEQPNLDSAEQSGLDSTDQSRYASEDQSGYVSEESSGYTSEEQYVEDGTTDKKSKKSKEKKPKEKKSNKLKEPEEVVVKPAEKTDCILYVVTDKPTRGLVEYMRSCGLNVTNIYDNIADIRNILLMQFENTRIAIIDSGSGKFITPTIRKELIDMIGANDEDTRFTVFYTDSILKSDATSELGKAAKSIEWIKYQSTPIFVASMLCHENENYVIDKANAYKERKEDSILAYIGDSPKDCELEKLGPLSITAASVSKNVLDESAGCIRKFKPRL